VGAEGCEGGGDGLSYLLLVGVVGDRLVGGGGEFDGDGRADEIVDGGYGGSQKHDGQVCILQSKTDLVGEAKTHG
jgi:hypothetical protein